MPITYDNKSTSQEGSSGWSVAHTTGTGDDRLMVVVFSIRDTGSGMTNIQYNSVSLTKVPSHADNSDGERVEIWYLKAPSTGNNNLTGGWTSGSPDTRITISTWEGVDQTNPYDTVGTNTGNSGNGTVNVTPTYDDSLVVGGYCTEDGSQPSTGSGETALYNTDEGTWATASSYVIQSGSASQQTVNWTGNDDYWAAVAATFKQSVTSYTKANSAKASIETTETKELYSRGLISRQYSWGESSSLPTNDNDLEVYYQPADETTVSTDDGSRVTAEGNEGYVIHLFKETNDNNTDPISPTWNGQASIAATSKTVYLQIYDRNLGSWETLDSNSSASADTDFTLTGTKSSSLSDYYDSNNTVACRIYQQD